MLFDLSQGARDPAGVSLQRGYRYVVPGLIAELFLAIPLYPGSSSYNMVGASWSADIYRVKRWYKITENMDLYPPQMQYMLENQYLPPDSMLDSRVHTKKYLQKDFNTNFWSLKGTQQFWLSWNMFVAWRVRYSGYHFCLRRSVGRRQEKRMPCPGRPGYAGWTLWMTFCMFEAQRYTKQQLTPRTRLIWHLSLLFFNVSGLATHIAILFRYLFRTYWFGPVCEHREGNAATRCLPSRHTTADPEPFFQEIVLLSWQSRQQLVWHYYAFKISHSWTHRYVFAYSLFSPHLCNDGW